MKKECNRLTNNEFLWYVLVVKKGEKNDRHTKLIKRS